MRKKILTFIYKTVSEHPRIVLAAVAILTLASLYSAKNLFIQTDLMKLLPDDSPLARMYAEFGALDYILAVVEVPEGSHRKDVYEISEDFAHAVNNREYIFSVEYKADPELRDFYFKDYETRVAQLLTDRDWENILELLEPDKVEERTIWLRNVLNTTLPDSVRERILSNPLNIDNVFKKRLAYSRGPLQTNTRRGYFLSADGRMLLMIVKPIKSSSDLLFTERLIGFLDSCRQAILARHAKEGRVGSITFIGNHIEIYNHGRIIRRDVLSTALISFFLVIGLFIAAFRRPSSILFVGLPLLVGLIWTIGITSEVIGHLSVVTFGFAAILIGLGADFAIHLYSRFSEEMINGSSAHSAMEKAIVYTGDGILVGALTTCVAFYGLMLTNFRGFQEFGFIAGTGILCCFVSMFFILPIMLLAMANRKKGEFVIRRLGSFGLGQITQTICGYPRLVIAGGIILTCYLGYHSMSIQFDPNIANLRQPSRDYENLMIRVKDKFVLPSSQLIAVVEDETFEGALEKNDRLYDLLEMKKDMYGILSYDSLRTVLPSEKSQLEAHKRLLSLDLIKTRKQLRMFARKYTLAPRVFTPSLIRFSRIQRYADKDNTIAYRIGADQTLQRTAMQYATRSEGKVKVVTHIYPSQEDWEKDQMPLFIDDFERNIEGVSFSGVSIVTRELRDLVQRNLAIAILLVIAVVFLILEVYFRNTKKAILAITPVMCSVLWMLGTMKLLGIHLNFLNIIITPIIIGLGIDDGIHILQRFFEEDKRDLVKAVEHTGRAVVITSLTTMVGFGTLIFADFRGIAQIGVLTILGIGYALLASLTILPAILRIWGRGFRLEEIIKPDEGVIR